MHAAALVRMNEAEIKALHVEENHGITATLGPKQVLNLRLTLDNV
jgi:hypothetical protein